MTAADPAAATVSMLRCADCGRIDSVGRIVCSGCLSLRLEPAELPGIGRLAAWTTIRRAPTRFHEDAPYDIAVVDLESGQRVTGRLSSGGPAPRVGAQVAAVAVDAPYTLFEQRST